MSNLVWISNNRWPDPKNLKTFMQGILDIENPKTGEERAIALYRWLNRVLILRDCNFEMSGNIAYVNQDAIKLLNVFCGHYCEGWGRLAAGLWNTTDLPAKKMVLSKKTAIHGHTENEFWYEDKDGISRWHAMDIMHQVAVYDKTGGHIASFAEMGEDLSLVEKPNKYLKPFYVRQQTKDAKSNTQYQLMPVESIAFDSLHVMDIPVRKGEEVIRYWDNFGKFHTTNKSVCSTGWHDPYSLYEKDGSIVDPIDEIWERQYMKICTEPTCEMYGKKVKYFGNGEIIYKPSITKKTILSGASPNPKNIEIEDGIIFPVREKLLSCLEFEVSSPYMMIESEIEVKFAKNGKYDIFEMCFSEGDPLNIIMLYAETAEKVTGKTVKVKLGKAEFEAGKPSAYGRYKYILRFQLLSTGARTDTRVESFSIKTTFQHNMLVLPRLLPGKNIINVEASKPDTLNVAYSYSDAKKKDKLEQFETNKKKSNHKITTAAKNPWEVKCNYLSVKNRE